MKTAAQLIDEFEQAYFAKRGRTPQTETTFKDYLKVLKHLPQSKVPTEATIKQLILTTRANSKTRVRYCTVLKSFSRFALITLNFDPSSLRGNYKPQQVKASSLPTDDQLLLIYEVIDRYKWSGVYMLIACYGLKNHQVFKIDWDDFKREGNYTLKIIESDRVITKQPCPVDWVDKYQLKQVQLPNVTGKTNSDLGHRVSEAFSNLLIPWSPQILRYCYLNRLRIG